MNKSNMLAIAGFVIGLSFGKIAMAQTAVLALAHPQVEQCYLAAQRVAGSTSASWEELQPCLEALEFDLSERQQVGTLVNLGLIQSQLGDFDGAQRNFDLALSISSAYPDTYLNRANLFYLKKDFEAAIRDYNEALRLEPSATDILYFNRGMAHQNLGEYSLAEMDYRAALTIRPGWVLVAEQLQALENQRRSTLSPGVN